MKWAINPIFTTSMNRALGHFRTMVHGALPLVTSIKRAKDRELSDINTHKQQKPYHVLFASQIESFNISLYCDLPQAFVFPAHGGIRAENIRHLARAILTQEIRCSGRQRRMRIDVRHFGGKREIQGNSND